MQFTAFRREKPSYSKEDISHRKGKRVSSQLSATKKYFLTKWTLYSIILNRTINNIK